MRIGGAIARTLLASISLVAVSVAVIWSFRPSLVHRVAKMAKDRYVAHYDHGFREAKDLLDNGDGAVGIEKMRALLESLSDIRKIDRLAPIKKKAFLRLAEAYVARDQIEEALAIYDRVVEFDDRDIDARLDRASLLLGMDTVSGRERGEAAIEELYASLPTDPLVIRKFLPLVVRRGDLAAASRAIYDYHRMTLDRALYGGNQWKFYWRTAGPFAGAQSWRDKPVVLGDGRVEFRKALPASEVGLRGIRVDLPRRIYVALQELRVVLESREAELLLRGEELRFKLGGMYEAERGTVVSRGKNRTSLVFDLPEEFSLAAGASFRFEAKIVPVFPEEMAPLLDAPDRVRAALGELKHAGDHGPADLLEQHSSKILSRTTQAGHR